MKTSRSISITFYQNTKYFIVAVCCLFQQILKINFSTIFLDCDYKIRWKVIELLAFCSLFQLSGELAIMVHIFNDSHKLHSITNFTKHHVWKCSLTMRLTMVWRFVSCFALIATTFTQPVASYIIHNLK